VDVPKFVVIDELHLTVRLPAAAPDRRVRAAVRALAGKELMARLRRAVRDVLRPTAPLAGCRVTLAR